MVSYPIALSLSIYLSLKNFFRKYNAFFQFILGFFKYLNLVYIFILFLFSEET